MTRHLAFDFGIQDNKRVVVVNGNEFRCSSESEDDGTANAKQMSSLIITSFSAFRFRIVCGVSDMA